VTQGERIPLPVVADSSAGMLRTGFLALDVSRVAGSPRRVRLAIRAPRGLARPPRLLRIEPNVLPVVQHARIERELHVANGLPDFSFELERAGVCFDAGEEPLRLEVRTETDFGEWRRCERLSEQGPNDAVYVLDVAQGRVLFGNGVNGRKPARGAEAYVSYAVSDGDAGNVAARRRWTVAGFAGVFGTNPDAVAGGTPRSDGVALRRRARLQTRQLHTLVSAADMEAAARDLPLLEVARAWVATPRGRETQLGTVRLVAMRRRGDDARPGPPPETPRWLEAVRRSLAARMPLGTRLAVEGPRYVDFSVDLAFEVETGRDPAVVARDVETTLRRRLALVPTRGAPEVRPVGLAVSRADTAAWVLGVDGVARVTRLELRRERTPRPVIRVGRDALPRLDPSRSVIDAHRAGAGNTT
jgi:predicted phage baseplate assembly protein